MLGHPAYILLKNAKRDNWSRRVCVSVCLYACLSLRMEKVVSHCTEILGLFRKSAENFH